MKLKAFTILEVLINMVITSIIIGLVYFIYSSFTQRITLYGSTVEAQNELELFCLQLKKDFYNSEKVIEENTGFTILFYDGKTVTYTMQESLLFRQQAKRRDSILLRNIAFTTIEDTLKKEKLIEELNVTLGFYNASVDYTVGKTYPNIFELESYER